MDRVVKSRKKSNFLGVGLRKILWFIAKAAGAGIISFATPRFLVALGVPLDEWILEMGGSILLTSDAAMWAATVCLGFTLFLADGIWRRWKNNTAPLASEPPSAGAFRYDDHQPTNIALVPNRALTKDERQLRLIADGRDLVHRYREFADQEDFNSYVRRHREYLDIQPHLGDDYQAGVIRRQRTVTPTFDGSDYEAAMFLRELARLEREWG
jgi:hypothetical protein